VRHAVLRASALSSLGAPLPLTQLRLLPWHGSRPPARLKWLSSKLTLVKDSTGEGATAVHGGALHTFLPTHTPMASPERRKPQRSTVCIRPLLPRGGPSAESDKGHFAAVNGSLITL